MIYPLPKEEQKKQDLKNLFTEQIKGAGNTQEVGKKPASSASQKSVASKPKAVAPVDEEQESFEQRMKRPTAISPVDPTQEIAKPAPSEMKPVPLFRDVNFRKTIVGVESGGDNSAVSPTGVKGQYQMERDFIKQWYPGGQAMEKEKIDQVILNPESARIAYERWAKHADSKYGGDRAKAAASYNAGDYVIDKAIERAKKSGGSWENYLTEAVSMNKNLIANLRGEGVKGTDAEIAQKKADEIKKHVNKTREKYASLGGNTGEMESSNLDIATPSKRDINQRDKSFGTGAVRALERGVMGVAKMAPDLVRAIDNPGGVLSTPAYNLSQRLGRAQEEIAIDDNLSKKLQDDGVLALLPTSLDNASLLGQMVIEQVPQLAAMFGASAVTGGVVNPLITRGIQGSAKAYAMSAETTARLIALGTKASQMGMVGVTSGAMEGSSAYDEAIKNGFTHDQAQKQAGVVGLVSGAMSLLLADEMSGGQMIDKVMGKAFRNQMVRSGVASATGEFAEEATIPLVSHLMSTHYDPEQKHYTKTAEEVAQEMLIGGTLGGIVGGGFGVVHGLSRGKSPTTPGEERGKTPTPESTTAMQNDAIALGAKTEFPNLFGDEVPTASAMRAKFEDIAYRAGVVNPAMKRGEDVMGILEDEVTPEEKSFLKWGQERGLDSSFNRNDNLTRARTEVDTAVKAINAMKTAGVDDITFEDLRTNVDKKQKYVDQLSRFVGNELIAERKVSVMEKASAFAVANKINESSVVNTAITLDNDLQALRTMKEENKKQGDKFDSAQIDTTIKTLSKALKDLGVEPAFVVDNDEQPVLRLDDDLKLEIADQYNIGFTLTEDEKKQVESMNKAKERIATIEQEIPELIRNGQLNKVQTRYDELATLRGNPKPVFKNGNRTTINAYDGFPESKLNQIEIGLDAEIEQAESLELMNDDSKLAMEEHIDSLVAKKNAITYQRAKRQMSRLTDAEAKEARTLELQTRKDNLDTYEGRKGKVQSQLNKNIDEAKQRIIDNKDMKSKSEDQDKIKFFDQKISEDSEVIKKANEGLQRMQDRSASKTDTRRLVDMYLKEMGFKRSYKKATDPAIKTEGVITDVPTGNVDEMIAKADKDIANVSKLTQDDSAKAKLRDLKFSRENLVRKKMGIPEIDLTAFDKLNEEQVKTKTVKEPVAKTDTKVEPVKTETIDKNGQHKTKKEETKNETNQTNEHRRKTGTNDGPAKENKKPGNEEETGTRYDVANTTPTQIEFTESTLLDMEETINATIEGAMVDIDPLEIDTDYVREIERLLLLIPDLPEDSEIDYKNFELATNYIVSVMNYVLYQIGLKPIKAKVAGSFSFDKMFPDVEPDVGEVGIGLTEGETVLRYGGAMYLSKIGAPSFISVHPDMFPTVHGVIPAISHELLHHVMFINEIKDDAPQTSRTGHGEKITELADLFDSFGVTIPVTVDAGVDYRELRRSQSNTGDENQVVSTATTPKKKPPTDTQEQQSDGRQVNDETKSQTDLPPVETETAEERAKREASNELARRVAAKFRMRKLASSGSLPIDDEWESLKSTVSEHALKNKIGAGVHNVAVNMDAIIDSLSVETVETGKETVDALVSYLLAKIDMVEENGYSDIMRTHIGSMQKIIDSITSTGANDVVIPAEVSKGVNAFKGVRDTGIDPKSYKGKLLQEASSSSSAGANFTMSEAELEAFNTEFVEDTKEYNKSLPQGEKKISTKVPSPTSYMELTDKGYKLRNTTLWQMSRLNDVMTKTDSFDYRSDDGGNAGEQLMNEASLRNDNIETTFGEVDVVDSDDTIDTGDESRSTGAPEDIDAIAMELEQDIDDASFDNDTELSPVKHVPTEIIQLIKANKFKVGDALPGELFVGSEKALMPFVSNVKNNLDETGVVELPKRFMSKDGIQELLDRSRGNKFNAVATYLDAKFGPDKNPAKELEYRFNRAKNGYTIIQFKIDTPIVSSGSVLGNVPKKAIASILNFTGNAVRLNVGDFGGSVHGYTSFDDTSKTYEIGLNSRLNDAEALVTLAHELGHAFLPTLMDLYPSIGADLLTMFEQDLKTDNKLIKQIRKEYGDISADRMFNEWVSHLIEKSPIFNTDGSINRNFKGANANSLVVRVYNKIKNAIYKLIAKFKGVTYNDTAERTHLADRVFSAMFKSGFDPKPIDKQFKLVSMDDDTTTVKPEKKEKSDDGKFLRGELSGRSIKNEVEKNWRERTRVSSFKEEIIDGVATGKLNKTAFGTVKKAVGDFLTAMAMNAEAMLEWYGFKKGDLIYDVFVEGYRKGQDTEHRIMNESMKHIEGIASKLSGPVSETIGQLDRAFKKKNRIAPRFATEVTNQDGTVTKLSLVPSERAALSAYAKNQHSRDKLTGDGFTLDPEVQPVKMTDAQLDILEASLTPDEKTIRDEMLKLFNGALWDETSKTFKTVNDEELKQEKNYVPYTLVANDVALWDIYDEQVGLNDFQNALINRHGTPGMTKERTDNKRAILLEDSFDLMLRHSRKVAHYAGFAEANMNAEQVLIKIKEVASKDGNMALYENLNMMKKSVAGENKVTKLERSFNKMYGKFATSVLGYRVFTAMKQLAALPLVAPEFEDMGIEFFKMFASVTKQFPGILVNGVRGNIPKSLQAKIDEVSQHSDTLASRFRGNIDVAVNELAMRGQKTPFIESAMSFITQTDTATITAVWEASKREASKKFTEGSKEFWDYVVEKTERITRQTQPTSDVKDRSFAMQHGFVKPFTMFFSARSATYAQIMRNGKKLKEAIESKDSKKIARATAAMLMSTIGVSLMLGLADELKQMLKREAGHDNAKEFGEILGDHRRYIAEALGTVVGLHMIIDWAHSGYKPSSPIYDVAGYGKNIVVSAEKATMGMLDAIGLISASAEQKGDGAVGELRKIAANIGEGAFMVSGVPIQGIIELVGFANEDVKSVK